MAADSSTSAQRRRATKPLIEKRRRARINSSLAQLKDIVAKPKKNTQENRSNRLEKADILEMTVDYVKRIHTKTNATEHSPHDVATSDLENSFKEGYTLCMSEVQNFFFKNYRKQASKQFLNRSIQNYLQQIFHRTVTGGNHSFQAIGLSSNTSICECKSERLSGLDNLRKKEGNDEFHSENSNFGSNYSSTSTDDEMTENFITPEANYQFNESLRLKNSILQRNALLHSGSNDVHVSERMWRPW